MWRFIQRLNGEGHTVLLTTHYLEEAEALCGRIAMLKRGRVVALDSTRNLLNSVAGCRVRLRLSGALPAALAPQLAEQGDDEYVLALPAYAALEEVLAQLRAAGVAVLEMDMQQSDLEEVFLRVVGRA
jgi:ABC-2 type transport system ATP-binding protein